MASYKVLTGLDYGDKRAEIGDVVSDIPAKSITWLLEQGLIEVAEEATKTSRKSTKTETVSEEEVA